MFNTSTIEKLFLSLCGETLRSNNGFNVRGELGTYSPALVVWLGITKRLNGGSLSDALVTLSQQLEDSDLSSLVERPSRKLREKNLSVNTGGLSRAQQRLSEELSQELFTESAQQVEKHFKELEEPSKPNIYILDGLVLTTSRTDATVQGYGTVRNRKKALHYPRVRCVAAHGLNSGVCPALAIGSYTDHETVLARKVFAQLPKNSIVVEDRGFAAPGLVAYAQEHGVKSVVRLKDSVAQKLLKQQGKETQFVWKAYSPLENKEVEIRGRIVHLVSSVPGFRTSSLYVFTNTELSDEELGQLYRQRVQVETAIRYIKQTLRLAFISARTPEAIRKEIYSAYLTFNLVRAIMQDTALSEAVPITRLSFTATLKLSVAYAPVLLSAKPKDIPAILARFKKHILECKIPLRKNSRSYPRQVKMQRNKYPLAATVDFVNTEKGK